MGLWLPVKPLPLVEGTSVGPFMMMSHAPDFQKDILAGLPPGVSLRFCRKSAGFAALPRTEISTPLPTELADALCFCAINESKNRPKFPYS